MGKGAAQMTIFRHEVRRGMASLAIWTAAIAFLLGVCILIYPEMGGQIDEVGAAFAEMGGFSQAFGMDRVNFGEFSGFFAIECGNVLGLGGALFAALAGISALMKEEQGNTAEFLLAHPVSRVRITAEKLCAAAVQVLLLNAVCAAVTAVCVKSIGEEPPFRTMALLFLAYFLMQLEILAVTFGLSACLRRGGTGAGLGLAAAFYFMNIIANLTERAEFLKYFTPFGYADGAKVIAEEALYVKYCASGAVFAVLGIAFAFWHYRTKEIA